MVRSNLKEILAQQRQALLKVKRTLVLDTSAFISGFDPFSVEDQQFSSPTVRQELASSSMSLLRFNAAVANKRLRIRKPGTFALQKVREESNEVGDLRYLSEADIEILALALELKSTGAHPVIITDDYSIQNVAVKISVNFSSLSNYGIRFRFNWLLYCPACHRKFASDYQLKTCGICGTELKRKPSRKFPLTKRGKVD